MKNVTVREIRVEELNKSKKTGQGLVRSPRRVTPWRAASPYDLRDVPLQREHVCVF